ncbi:hypothetical protein A3715_15595 [Oleiphilus sp. HI0009]|nr:hypothetical protein A3715_15595 [Oleiphilus sp. HI0009]
MKTQKEMDDALISSVNRMITFAKPSYTRCILFLASSALLGIFQLSMQEGILSTAISFIFIVLMLISLVEVSRFGYLYDWTYGGWKSLLALIVSFIAVFMLHRLFEYLEWFPLHRTAGWAIGAQFGFILGVLCSQVVKREHS